MNKKNSSNTWVMGALAALILASSGGVATAADKVRLALPTKGYWGTVVATAAQEKGLFQKAGVEAEITVFRSGADAFQALAADAADVSLASPTIVAQGLKKGVSTKIVGIACQAPLGWHLVVKADSPIKNVNELSGKKVGMNSAGSLSDLLGKWAASKAGIAYELVPLGGGGVAPNLLAGNIDATVLYAPITYDMLNKGQIRSLLDFSKEMPKAATDTWTASDKALSSNGKAIRNAVSALFDAVGLLQKDRDYAIDLISRNDDVSKDIATFEYERTIMNLPSTNSLDPALINQYLDFAKPFAPDLARADKITASAQ
ncbi:ABC transporter substrate-binding protein [Mesorhizobium sp. SP-1A]|uniref:ABC transporter substrate-binding protein n=1 Tax=Mesorhizobium sp. SP-1A TaxID=3077840 RepID=UPI0028F6C226|nr:ABC transporter substrate-binding protein [Mesorhizobium sp. SP-1A]